MGDMAASHSYPPTSPAEFGPEIGRTATKTAAGTGAGQPAPAKAHKRAQLIREAACHCTLIIAGWSDSSSGPLIPYIQAYFGISYTVVSLLFVGQMVGFLAGALSNGWLTARFGMGKVITAGAVVQSLGYVFLVPAFRFPSFPIIYALIGFGMSLQDAQANTYVATLPNPEHRFALLHASYGVGAVVCPAAATAFASSGIKFSYFYCISIGLALLNVLILVAGFKFNYRIDYGQDTAPKDIPLQPIQPTDDDREKQTPPPSPSVERAGHEPADVDSVAAAEGPKRGMLAETLAMPQLWLYSLFIVLYVGAEVSMGGWIVTFVQQERGGTESAGYVATGFWLGLLLGRATLSFLTARVGEKRVMFIYLAIALGLEFAVWFADSLVGNAVTVGLIGYAMGPAYPIVMTVASRVIPRRLHATALGFIAAFGQLGAAILPFCVGALSQKTSPAALQPVLVVLLAAMLGIWFFVRDAVKKVE